MTWYHADGVRCVDAHLFSAGASSFYAVYHKTAVTLGNPYDLSRHLPRRENLRSQ